MNFNNLPVEALSKETLISLLKAYDEQSVNTNYQSIEIQQLKTCLDEYRKDTKEQYTEIRELKNQVCELTEENTELKNEINTFKNTKKSQLLKENQELKDKLKELEKQPKKEYEDDDGLCDSDGEETDNIF